MIATADEIAGPGRDLRIGLGRAAAQRCRPLVKLFRVALAPQIYSAPVKSPVGARCSGIDS
jgi:hypothetical protein